MYLLKFGMIDIPISTKKNKHVTTNELTNEYVKQKNNHVRVK